MKIVAKTLKKNHNLSYESEGNFVWKYVKYFCIFFLGTMMLFYLISLIIIQLIPLEKEIQWFGRMEYGADISLLPEILKERYRDIPYQIKIIDESEPNAYALIGGNILLTQGLLENLDSYEELDFIIGHEIGHIENRDVIRQLSFLLPIQLLLNLMGIEGSNSYSGILGIAYGKKQESNADISGIRFVVEKNNHIGCALDFFEKKNSIFDNISEIFSQHPMTKNRIQNIQNYIQKQGFKKEACTPFIPQ